MNKKADTSAIPNSRGWHMPTDSVALQGGEKTKSISVIYICIESILDILNPFAQLIEQASVDCKEGVPAFMGNLNPKEKMQSESL
jgi:hypothetical protein